ncbi:helix-turn-helix domain-containing protein, partial [Klebsiella michiganensis]|uniref:helix-turn-helix domain-containing protein n=1 Tax=Klebsiella michiganensis TaxID=1134687 RepID=UPI0025A12DE3
ADEKIKLTNYQFEIMRLLIKKSGKLISKYEIMKHLHDDVFNQNNNSRSAHWTVAKKNCPL